MMSTKQEAMPSQEMRRLNAADIWPSTAHSAPLPAPIVSHTRSDNPLPGLLLCLSLLSTNHPLSMM
jgi:hypothetical protein